MDKIKKNKKKNSKVKQIVVFPLKVLKPIANFLSEGIVRLERKKKDIASRDPFNDPERVNDNASSDTDAAEQVGHERIKALEKQINSKLIQTKKALSMIKIGRYGVCEKCGKMIDTDRLMIMPEATVCIKCEKNKEK